MGLFKMDLQMFAEGVASAEGLAVTANNSGENTSDAAKQTKRKSVSTEKAKADLSKVIYGKQPSVESVKNSQPEKDSQTQETVNAPISPEERQEAYERLKTEYKDLYDNEVQGIVRSRIRNAKAAQEKLDSLSPVIDILAKRYGLDPGDTKSLEKAVSEDDSYFEKEAYAKGVDPEQYKQMKKLENENESFRKAMEEQRRRQNIDRMYQRWMDEAEAVKGKYPNFDLQNELKNERFLNLIQTPSVDVKTAYELVHHDELFASFGQEVAQKTRQRAVNEIKANSARPTENGTIGHAVATVKSDVRSLTKADREEISRRVMRGEKITF